MSSFWHKMSDLKPVCWIKMWKLTEKSHFCALSVMFLRLVCILKLEGLLQGYVKWKNTMTCNVNFLTQNVGSETSLLNYMWKLTEKSHFCALSVMFLRLVCILSWKVFFKAMLSGKTQWRVMSTFWHKMSDLKPVCSINMIRYVFEASEILTLEGLLQVGFLTQNVGKTSSPLHFWG